VGNPLLKLLMDEVLGQSHSTPSSAVCDQEEEEPAAPASTHNNTHTASELGHSKPALAMVWAKPRQHRG